ncbi:MAG: hypothetical protein U0792_01625 [Gemmataceae bacterium]
MPKKNNSLKWRAGIVLGVGLIIIGVTAWKTFPRRVRQSMIDPSTARFMHCPECMAESRCNPDALDKECVYCGSEKGLIPTLESVKTSQTKSAYGKLVAFVLPEIVLLLAAFYFVIRPHVDTGEEKFRFTRCPYCSQKLRYREAQIDNLGACSQCKRAFRFPEGVAAEHTLDGGAKVLAVEEEEDDEDE